MPVPFCQVATAWYCDRSYLTVGSGFPSRNCPFVYCSWQTGSRQKLAASLYEMTSASRQIASRRLGNILASAEATVSRHFSAKTAQISI